MCVCDFGFDGEGSESEVGFAQFSVTSFNAGESLQIEHLEYVV